MEGIDNFPLKVQRILKNRENLPFHLSAISPWEVVKKESIGKLVLTTPIRSWLAKATDETFISILPLSTDISWDANHLPGDFHRDPADQIIVATARVHNLTLITRDSRILAYPHVKTIKA